MPRQIIVDETKETEQVAVAETTTETRVPPVCIGDEKVLIASTEMKKVFHEWDANGKNDLFIIPSLAERIRQYLAYQEELDPLKEQLAKRIYKPYLVEVDEKNYRNFSIKVNGKNVVEASCYLLNGYYKAISVGSFKSILASLQNPYAPYIKGSSPDYIDFLAYVIANGGSFEFNSGEWEIKL